MERPVMTPEEAVLPYAKYFSRPMADIPQEKLALWSGPAAKAEDALPIEQRAYIQDARVPGFENGFCVAPNGTGFVANTTFMPGVTAAMFDWWFGWHSVTSDLRYKLWDPDDHYYARADKPDYVKDPKVPDAEKTWGVMHKILEDIGMGADELLLCFKKPSDLGYDMAKLGTPSCLAMVCAYGLGSTPAIMTHVAKAAEGGILFCSRFWMGYGPNEKDEIVKLVPDGVCIPEAPTRSLFGHNIKEYSNLASILPNIYAEERDKPW